MTRPLVHNTVPSLFNSSLLLLLEEQLLTVTADSPSPDLEDNTFLF